MDISKDDLTGLSLMSDGICVGHYFINTLNDALERKEHEENIFYLRKYRRYIKCKKRNKMVVRNRRLCKVKKTEYDMDWKKHIRNHEYGMYTMAI